MKNDKENNVFALIIFIVVSVIIVALYWGLGQWVISGEDAYEDCWVNTPNATTISGALDKAEYCDSLKKPTIFYYITFPVILISN